MKALLNLIWLLFSGLWLAVGHLLTAAAMATRVIGIPLAITNFMLIPASLMPPGKQIVPSNPSLATSYRTS